MFWGYFGGIVPCKYKTNRSVFEDVKVILKRIMAKRINFVQTTGVDKYSLRPLAFLLHYIKEFTSRRPIEIPHQS